MKVVIVSNGQVNCPLGRDEGCLVIANPRMIGSVETPGYAYSVAISWDLACVADGWAGLQVYPAQCEVSGVGDDIQARSMAPLQAFPNPTTSQTFIRFESGRSGPVQMDVYDLAGRLVRRLSQ